MSKSTIAKHTALSTASIAGRELSIQIMEDTGRFEFISEDGAVLSFWDNEWENSRCISADWSLKKLIQWIITVYSESSMYEGEMKAQRRIRTALGLD